jgi:hypothetical protein
MSDAKSPPMPAARCVPHAGRYAIIAEAKFDRQACQRYSKDVKRAWHVDIPRGSFTVIDPEGVVCEDFLSGNDPTTMHCQREAR